MSANKPAPKTAKPKKRACDRPRRTVGMAPSQYEALVAAAKDDQRTVNNMLYVIVSRFLGQREAA